MSLLPIASRSQFADLINFTQYTGETEADIVQRLADSGIVDLPITVNSISVDNSFGPIPTTVIPNSAGKVAVALLTGKTEIGAEGVEPWTFNAVGAVGKLGFNVAVAAVLACCGIGIKTPEIDPATGELITDTTERDRLFSELTSKSTTIANEETGGPLIMWDADNKTYINGHYATIIARAAKSLGIIPETPIVDAPTDGTPFVAHVGPDTFDVLMNRVTASAPLPGVAVFLQNAAAYVKTNYPAYIADDRVLYICLDLQGTVGSVGNTFRINIVSIPDGQTYEQTINGAALNSMQTGSWMGPEPGFNIGDLGVYNSDAANPVTATRIVISTYSDCPAGWSQADFYTAQYSPNMAHRRLPVEFYGSFTNPTWRCVVSNVSGGGSGTPEDPPAGFYILDDGSATLYNGDFSAQYPDWQPLETSTVSGRSTNYWYPCAGWFPDPLTFGTENYLKKWVTDGAELDFVHGGVNSDKLVQALYDGAINNLFEDLAGIQDLDVYGDGTSIWHWPDDSEPLSDLPTDFALDRNAANSGFIGIYSPSLATLRQFSAWLWGGGNIVDKLKQYFASPIDAVVQLSQIYINPDVLGATNINCGYLDSGLLSNVVSQYATADCGSLKIPAKYRDIFDYAPYTDIQLYLPFIGYISLDPAQVIDKTLSIKYGVDVITGECLASIFVDGKLIDTERGAMSANIPVTGGNKVANMLSTITGAVGGAMQGAAGGWAGVAAGAAAGAASGFLSNFNKITFKGGNYTGAIGAFGPCNPYLVITRQLPADPANYARYYGGTAVETRALGSCLGYVEMDKAILDGVPATGEELDEIRDLLREGVLV